MHFALSLLLSFVLVDLVYMTDADSHLFQIAPSNVTIYYNIPKQFVRTCVPPSNSDFVIVWYKNAIRIKNNVNNDSTTITSITDAKTIASLHVAAGSKVSVLTVNPMSWSDVGEYLCVATNDSRHFVARFYVKITDKCKEGSFKCFKDKKCIMSYSVCDGIPQCSNAYDESVDAGCSLPSVPKQLKMESTTINTISIKWQPVVKATGYEVNIQYTGNKSKSIKVDSPNTLTEVSGLKPNQVYIFRVRSISLVGYSDNTLPLAIKTHNTGYPGVPQNLRPIAITISDINVIWDEVEDATSYEIVITFPDGERISEYTDAHVPVFLFRNLINDTSHGLKVRARSSTGYGNYSKQILVKTLKINPPGSPTDARASPINIIKTVRLAWKPPRNTGNSHPTDLQYSVKYCVLKPYMGKKEIFKNVTVNETMRLHHVLAQDVINKDNSTKINSQTHKPRVGLKKPIASGWELRIVRKKVNVTVIMYKKSMCQNITLTRPCVS